jgi:prepilin-type N-terminal cleavage/methylation domain-containing protein
MLKSCKVNKSRAGFTLVEALIALAVGALFLSVIVPGFANVWMTLGITGDTSRAMDIARNLASRWRDGASELETSGEVEGFRYRFITAPLSLQRKDANLPPAPPSTSGASGAGAAGQGGAAQGTSSQNQPNGAPAPAAPGGPAAAPLKGKLLRFAILVTAPSGRTLRYETAKFEIEKPDQTRGLPQPQR